MWASSCKDPAWNRIVLHSDSRCGLEAISDIDSRNPFVFRIREKLMTLESSQVSVVFAWVRSHTGVEGNERADFLARGAIRKRVAPSFTDFPLSFAKAKIREKLHSE